MSRHFSQLICFYTLGLLLAVSVRAECADDDKEVAKKHFKAGLMLLETDNYQVAAQEFESSVALYPTKNGYFNLANCLLALHRYDDALAAVDKLKVEFYQDLDKNWLQEIASLEQKLEEMTIRVMIHVTVDGATVQVDGVPKGESPLEKPLLLDPGEHELEVSAKLYQDLRKTIVLETGQDEPQHVHLEMSRAVLEEGPTAADQGVVELDGKDDLKRERKKKRIWTWVTFGAGALTGIGAIITGSLAMSYSGQLDEKCFETPVGESKTEMRCGHHLRNEVEKTQTMGSVTNVLLGATATTAMLGTILFFVEGDDDDEDFTSVRFAPAVSPGGAGFAMTGTF